VSNTTVQVLMMIDIGISKAAALVARHRRGGSGTTVGRTGEEDFSNNPVYSFARSDSISLCKVEA
jgi:hypothetical protein